MFNTLKQRKRTKISSFVINFILIILSILILTLGIYSMIKTVIINKTYILTEARITSIFEEDGLEMFRVKFPFEDGEKEASMRSFDPTLEEGDLINVYVNPNDYSEVRFQIKDNYLSSIMLIVIGVLVLAINLFFVIKVIVKNNRITYIIRKGNKTVGKVISVDEGDNLTSPKTVQVLLENGCTIQSENIYVTYSIKAYVGKYADVYMVNDDVNYAFIDIDSVSLDSKGTNIDKDNRFDD